MSAEYSTGTIRATFCPAPRRTSILAAKALVFGAVALVTSEVVAFASFFLGQAFLTAPEAHATIGSPGALRAVAGSGLFLCVMGLFALGLATIIRHTAGAISAFVGLLLVLPLIVQALPSSLNNDLLRVLGAVAGLRAPARRPLEHPVRVVAFHGTADSLNPFAGSGTARWNESVPDAAAAWARALGLPSEPTPKELTDHLTRMDFGDPSDAAAVTLFVSRGAGHTWPGSRLPLFAFFPMSPLSPLFLRLILGRTSKEIDATTEIWRAAEAPD